MKTKDFFKSLLIAAAMILTIMSIAAASGDFHAERSIHREEITANIISVTTPEVVIAGIPAPFEVIYLLPDACHNLRGNNLVFTSLDSGIFNVFIRRSSSAVICNAVIIEESRTFDLTFPHPGTFTLEYSTGYGINTIEVKVEHFLTR
jgi:hypothetical protein